MPKKRLSGHGQDAHRVGARPIRQFGLDLRDSPHVVDHAVIDVHLAEVAKVVLAQEPLAGLVHGAEVEAAEREEVLVGPADAVEPGAEVPPVEGSLVKLGEFWTKFETDYAPKRFYNVQSNQF